MSGSAELVSSTTKSYTINSQILSGEPGSLRSDHWHVADSRSAVAKRLFDLTVALLACLVFSPLIVLLALFLILFQGRPVLIAHRRLGQAGRLFPCFKFRTMVTNANEALAEHLKANPDARREWEATRKLRDDPRITPFGAVLRKSSADELPQLLNIIRGEMSLVGPRPIVEEEVVHYGPYIHYYLQVRPGLTGAWQISGRNDTTYQQRVELDTEYARSGSFGRDLQIIIRTIPAVLRSKGCY